MNGKTKAVGIAVAALVVGYALGFARESAPAARAEAGPTLDATNSVFVTQSLEGQSIIVWKMAKGEPVEARQYYTRTKEEKDAKGQTVETRQLSYVLFPGPAREYGK